MSVKLVGGGYVFIYLVVGVSAVVDIYDLSLLSCCCASHVVTVTSTAYIVTKPSIYTSSTTHALHPSFFTGDYAVLVPIFYSMQN